ncbi:MAG: hypothetical protein IIV87_00125 [Oscillospiraceae bacterium]|nr:hypothetical protein [Oscillospiraceae bacterium]
MFRKFSDALRRFMYGRYGSDQLNQALLVCGLVFLLIGWLGQRFIAPWLGIFNLLFYVPMIWCLVRMYSRNIAARRRENAAWMRFVSRLKDREHRYFRCPRCRQTVRVPSCRGKISIRCPKCGAQFIKRT